MNKKQPEALRLAEMLTADEWPGSVTLVSYARECVAELRRLHAENERISCLCDKWNSECDEFREDNKRLAAALAETQQGATEPTQEMLDQVSFDRKPDCYGIRQITDDEGVEEWEDIRTSPDVAREEANDMMATGRGEIYEVVPLWTTPQPSPTAQAAESVPAPQQPAQDDALIRQLVEALEGYRRNHHDAQPCDAERAGRARLECKP